MAYCPHCGAESNGAYCPQCGTAIGIQSSASPIGEYYDKDANPFAVGAQSAYDSTYYCEYAPNIPSVLGAFGVCFKKYCSFQGRASRTEYWGWTLVNTIVLIPYFVVFSLLTIKVGLQSEATDEQALLFGLLSLFYCAYVLVTFLPNLAVTVRRLHDSNFPGLLVLLGFIPYIGILIIMIFMCLPPTMGPNNYGPQPIKR